MTNIPPPPVESAKPPKRYSYEEFVSLHAPLTEFTSEQRTAMYEKWKRGEVRRMWIRKELGHKEES